MIYYIPNHKSHELRSCEPEDLPRMNPRPDFPSKAAMLDWAQDPNTDHCFYSLAQPRNPALRLTKENPVSFLHGIVADYDIQFSDEEVEAALSRIDPVFPAFGYSRTFSGGLRVLWLFPFAVPAISDSVVGNLIEKAKRSAKLLKVAPGLDEPALADPARYYELGTDWVILDPAARIPGPNLTVWIQEACRNAKFAGDEGLRWEDIEAEVNRRFPGRWESKFVPGAYGPRFWDSTADNPRGCWLRENGVIAFTGEGRFLPWTEILGKDFVRQKTEAKLGGAVDGVWYDGRGYWLKGPDGNWRDSATDPFIRHLCVVHGLSTKAPKGGVSEVTAALSAIESQRRVDGAFPFLYRLEDVVTAPAGSFVNISRARLVPPAPDGSAVWGEDFGWLANYLERLFDPKQREVFLAWLGHFYRSAHAHHLRKGQGLFVAGPPGSGKTFLSQRVIGDLMGGSEEATSFILGATSFNKTLFNVPVWTVDDATASADERGHRIYSTIVKKIVANFSLQYHPKYKDAVSLPWEGRLVVTLNDDPESIQMLPTVEHSILDKLVMLKASDTGLDFTGAQEIVAKELPYFAAWLLKQEIPPHLRGDYRFGVKAYHHPDLLQTAKNVSNATSFRELLDLWREQYFRGHSEPFWEGTPTDLLFSLNTTEGLHSITDRSFPSAHAIALALNKLVNQGGHGIEFVPSGRERRYRIHKNRE